MSKVRFAVRFCVLAGHTVRPIVIALSVSFQLLLLLLLLSPLLLLLSLVVSINICCCCQPTPYAMRPQIVCPKADSGFTMPITCRTPEWVTPATHSHYIELCYKYEIYFPLPNTCEAAAAGRRDRNRNRNCRILLWTFMRRSWLTRLGESERKRRQPCRPSWTSWRIIKALSFQHILYSYLYGYYMYIQTEIRIVWANSNWFHCVQLELRLGGSERIRCGQLTAAGDQWRPNQTHCFVQHYCCIISANLLAK